MQQNQQQTLDLLRASLEELTLAYNAEPSSELLANIFQLQVAIQELESSTS